MKSKIITAKSAKQAREIGDILCEVKEQVGKYGHWQDWLEDNFEGSYSSASVYMRISKKWKCIPKELRNDPNLSIGEALSLINNPNFSIARAFNLIALKAKA